jgi:hypothetical protein
MTYRTGNHWGVTVVREFDHIDVPGGQPRAELVAVVVNGDQALAERICALLNGVEAYAYSCLGCGKRYATTMAAAECDSRHRTFVADSCTCSGNPDPDCPVHHGRRARGPQPPPVGPGCICDGSGRTCPRHGAVI